MLPGLQNKMEQIRTFTEDHTLIYSGNDKGTHEVAMILGRNTSKSL